MMSLHLSAWLRGPVLGLAAAAVLFTGAAHAQDRYSGSSGQQYDVYRETPDPEAGGDSRYGTPTQGGRSYQSYGANDTYRPNDTYRAPQGGGSYGSGGSGAYGSSGGSGYGSGSAYNNGPSAYNSAPPYGGNGDDGDYRRYDSGPGQYADEPGPGGEPGGPPPYADDGQTYSKNEIIDAGHKFFGSVSKGLADVVEYAFKQSGRPNGYILGEDAGGAFVAGLRYGEGMLHTRFMGTHKVYWQGPSVGYDFGGEGSKTMILVYNLQDPSQIYDRFPGVQGSAYMVGGVGIQFQKLGNVTLAPIRAGVGLRFGANIGYLKYTRSPTWNPF